MNYNTYLFVFILTNLPVIYLLPAHNSNQTTKNRTAVAQKRAKLRSPVKGETVLPSLRKQVRQLYEGPKRGEKYDPSHGFEPYWPHGKWVYSFATSTQGHTTENLNLNCGRECGVLYASYGAICARTPRFEYRTFKTYCAMRSTDCSGEKEWRVLYKGSCVNNTVFERNKIITHVARITDFMKIYGFTERCTAAYFFDKKIASKFAWLRQYHFTFKYGANVGYEPYWGSAEIVGPDGVKRPAKAPTRIPSSVVLVCGEGCNVSYREIKEVCTHYTESNDMEGCVMSDPKHCTGNPGLTFSKPFRQFQSYCHYLAATCASHIKRYVLLYIGKCKSFDEIFKPMSNGTDVLERLKSYSLLPKP